MKLKNIFIAMVFIATFALIAEGTETSQESSSEEENGLYPWCGQYPMSMFTKTRSSKLVGKDHLSVSVNFQYYDWDQVRGADNDYHNRASGQSKERSIYTFCAKYGWAKDHHIAVGIPYWMNDFDIPGKENDSQGLADIYVFEKWELLKETNTIPGVAVDFWYYFSSGDSDRSLGTGESAYKISTEVSKAWKDFSLHFNPNYKWSADKDDEVGEINGTILFTPDPKLWPAIEYNYFVREHKGHSHDLVPGIIWKFKKGWSFKVGVPMSMDSTFTDRDVVSIVLKLFRRW
ncbi:MAG: transporter [Sedimentisphaerales bacterium]|nr:transporter [Sedimentisphaerales bacterium]